MMEAKIPQTIRPPALINTEKLVGKTGGFFQANMFKNKQRHKMLALSQMPKANTGCNSHPVVEVRRSTKNHPVTVLKTGGLPLSMDDALLLKNKSQEIEPYIDGRCIYLVGMMGSGKTTVGRILADVLGYSFFDSDALVEQAVGGMPVSEIFKLHGEGFFRDNETEVLRNLSLMQRLVVSTGGGAVVRPINWKYMRHGISVWLDVPLEALARRIAAVGTSSRPLLHHESEDAYSKTFVRLTSIMQERSEAYANANARVSLECIAAKLGFRDVANLSPAMIAIETLQQIESFLKEDGIAT